MISTDVSSHFLFITNVIEFNEALLTFSSMIVPQERVKKYGNRGTMFVTFVNSVINLGGGETGNHVKTPVGLSVIIL